MPGVEGAERAVRIANAAVEGNFMGPLISAVTFVSRFFELWFGSSWVALCGATIEDQMIFCS